MVPVMNLTIPILLIGYSTMMFKIMGTGFSWVISTSIDLWLTGINQEAICQIL
jgi:hypothetical protein